MRNYVIIAPTGSRLTEEHVKKAFDRVFTITDGFAWAVGADEATCSDVRDKLGPRVPGQSSVIVKATEYNGYASKDLWEKLAVWETS